MLEYSAVHLAGPGTPNPRIPPSRHDCGLESVKKEVGEIREAKVKQEPCVLEGVWVTGDKRQH